MLSWYPTWVRKMLQTLRQLNNFVERKLFMKNYQKPEIEVVKFTVTESITDVISGSTGIGIPDIPIIDEE